jgi:hypothetical protein
MSDSTQNEYNFFQFDPLNLGDDWAKGAGAQQMRNPDMKMSNFGALNYGTRRSTDYTRVAAGFEAKDDLMNPVIPSFLQEAERDENPFVLGSSIKRVRDDKFTRMGMGSNDQPKFDVMDTNEVHSGMTSGKNWPSEGWHSFGRKYDGYAEYDGTLR